MKPEDMKILVIGDRVWGKGDTLKKALEKAQKPRHYFAYIIHPDSYVDEMGTLVYNSDFPPKKIHEVLPKKAKAKK